MSMRYDCAPCVVGVNGLVGAGLPAYDIGPRGRCRPCERADTDLRPFTPAALMQPFRTRFVSNLVVANARSVSRLDHGQHAAYR
jgi:hypothetical protein